MALVKVDNRIKGKLIVSAELATSTGTRKVAVAVFADAGDAKVDAAAAQQGVDELHRMQAEMRDGASKRGTIQ